MKVQYKCTFERVNEVIDQALTDDREIEFIELTAAEWGAFGKIAGAYTVGVFHNKNPHEAPITDIMYRDVQIRKRTHL